MTLLPGCPMETIAALSNLAGGLVCEQVGVVPVNRDLLLTETATISLQLEPQKRLKE